MDKYELRMELNGVYVGNRNIHSYWRRSTQTPFGWIYLDSIQLSYSYTSKDKATVYLTDSISIRRDLKKPRKMGRMSS